MSDKLQFRVIVGSYEHSLLCLSVILPLGESKVSPYFQPIFHFQAHSLSIRAMDIAKRYLVTGSNDEHIKIYDLQKRKELGTLLQHQGSITTLRFSDEHIEEKKLNHTSKKHDVDEEEEEEDDDDDDEEQKTQVKALANTKEDGVDYISHKTGKWLLSASDDGKIVIWRTKDWEQFGILKGHTGRINDLAIHPSGRIAVSVSEDKTVKLWNLMTAKKASTLKLKGRDTLGQSGQVVEWNSTGDFFTVGFLTRMIIFNTRTAKIVQKIKFNVTIMKIKMLVLNNVEYLIISLNNGSIVLLNFNDLLDTQLSEDENEIDFKNLNPAFTLVGHASRVKDFAVYQEKRNDTGKILTYLVSISSDGKIVIWDMDTKDQVAAYDTGERLNVVTTVNESVEKQSEMKPIYNPEASKYSNIASESEYESDAEGLAEIMKGKKPTKKSKKMKRKQQKKLLKVEYTE